VRAQRRHRLGSRISSARAAAQLAAQLPTPERPSPSPSARRSTGDAGGALREKKMSATQQRAATCSPTFTCRTPAHPQRDLRPPPCAIVHEDAPRSMDDIVDMAHMLILDTIGARAVPERTNPN